MDFLFEQDLLLRKIKIYGIIEHMSHVPERPFGIESHLVKELAKNKIIEFAFIFDAPPSEDGPKRDPNINLFIIGDINEDDIYTIIKRVENKTYRRIDYTISIMKEFQAKLKRPFFTKEITKNYRLLVGDPAEFKKLIAK